MICLVTLQRNGFPWQFYLNENITVGMIMPKEKKSQPPTVAVTASGMIEQKSSIDRQAETANRLG